MGFETWMIPLTITILMFVLAILKPQSTYSYEYNDSYNNGFIGAFWISIIAWVLWYVS